MYKFIAQLLISATVGVAVAAGTDADVRGYIGEALREPGVYIQESANAVARTAAQFSSNSEENYAAGTTDVNVTANEKGSADNSQAESATDVSAQSSSEVQVDSTLNVENVIPEVLGLDAGAAVDAQTETDASLETEDEDLDLSLWQQLGLSLGFDIEDEE